MAGYMETSKCDEWETPQWLFDRLNNVFEFMDDLACTRDNFKVNYGCFSEGIQSLSDLGKIYNA